MNQLALQPHVQALGLDWGASPDMVKRAWHRAVRRCHPDVAGHDGTERMATINAAYTILRHGVPSLAMVEGRPRFTLRVQKMTVSEDVQSFWRFAAMEKLAQMGIETRPLGLLDRLRRRKPGPAVHVPKAINIYPGRVEFVLDAPSLGEGDQYMLVPELTPKGKTLAGTGAIEVLHFATYRQKTTYSMEHMPELDRMVLPHHLGLKVVISTAA